MEGRGGGGGAQAGSMVLLGLPPPLPAKDHENFLHTLSVCAYVCVNIMHVLPYELLLLLLSRCPGGGRVISPLFGYIKEGGVPRSV